MRIQHNILAMNAYRNYNTNTSALAKNLEKLSSGYKINRAGDDAAGLAISEKMRAQITGLNAASKNVKDGISLVKTAEGAMQEIQDMLNRMDYLATQSANGTYDDPVDRMNLNKEMSALKEEINRIADSANFNGINLLDGSLDPNKVAAENAANADAANAADAAEAAEAAEEDAKNFTSVTVTQVKDHEISNGPQKLKFTLDLSSLRVTTTSQTVGTGDAVTIMAGAGTSDALTITATATSTGTLSGITFTATGGQVTIAGVKFNVKMNGTDKIEFEMVDNPTTAQVNLDLGTVSVSCSTTYGNANFGESNMYHIDTPAIAGDEPDQAQGTFDLATVTNNNITDGARLKIGDKTYVFQLKDTTATVDAAKGEIGVDLSDLTVDGKVTDMTGAAARLSGAANGQGDFIVSNNNGSSTIALTERLNIVDGKSVTKDTYELSGGNGDANATWVFTDKASQADQGKSIVQFNASAKPAALTPSTPDKSTLAGKLTLQIGDTADTFNQLDVKIGDMHVSAMGTMETDATTGVTSVTSGKSIADINITTAENAHNAIDVIKNAINYVSSIRGDLGAIQNRLEHTSNNLSVMTENIQDAESTIRDTDVAEEMMAYTKNNILIQSAQAMLAQANAVPQGVLQLLG